MRQLLISVFLATCAYAIAIQGVFERLVARYVAADAARAELIQVFRP